MIDATIIAKKVISTVTELDVIENRLGRATIAPTMQINDIASVAPFNNVNGKHKVERFKNPVKVRTSTQSVLYSSSARSLTPSAVSVVLRAITIITFISIRSARGSDRFITCGIKLPLIG